MSFSLVRNFGATDSPTGVLSCMDVGVRVAKVGATIPLCTKDHLIVLYIGQSGTIAFCATVLRTLRARTCTSIYAE